MTSHPSSPHIARLHSPPAYSDFLQRFLIPNIPVIISAELTRDWPATLRWTLPASQARTKQEPGNIDWRFLAERFGHHEVSVADCARVDSFGNLECEIAVFRDVVAQWERGEGRSLYVKDWHLARAVEGRSSQAQPFYTTPDIFKDDWMNACYTARTEDDFRFVYVGAAGTYTPLHRDVYCSYSWSTNISGRKRWWLFPPEQTYLLFMRERRVCIHDVRHVDAVQFPDYSRTTPIVVDQEAGETIFVPSGWYHQVVNLTDCVSINHNWCNAVNLPMLYSSMCEKVVEVESALDDVRELLEAPNSEESVWRREFCEVVQGLVQQDAGWNWLTFWKMILHVLENSAAEAEGDAAVQPHLVFPCAPPHLRPSIQFVLERIGRCHAAFQARDRYECEGEVQDVVARVAGYLNAIQI